MSRIDEMIKELCPEGLMYKSLGELADEGLLSLGRGQIISKNDMRETPGDFPVYSSSSQNNGEIGSYGKYMFDDERITWSIDGGGILFYRNNLKYSVTNVCGWLKVNCPDVLSTKYLYYTMFQQWTNLIFDYTHKAHPSVIRDEYIIPLPSLCIQQKIVSVLDSFTTLIDKMKQEVEKRKKQMEYYREKLITFEDGECEWKTLGEATIVSRGKRVVRKDLLEVGSIPVYQNSLKPLGYANESNYPENTTFIISAGAAGEVGYSKIKYWGADDCFSILSVNLDSRFIYHWLKIKESFLQSRIRGGAIKRLSRDIVDNLPIPIITIKKQAEIVSTLDKFESYITKLEKMITLRQKQYEYYREQLLTFE